MSNHIPGTLPEGLGGSEWEVVAALRKKVRDEYERRGWSPDSDAMLIANGSWSYRDPKEGLLQVYRAPHQVRPPSDTGVHCRLHPTEEKTELSLNDPPNQAQYRWDSFQLQTRHTLCQACLDAFHYYCEYVQMNSTVSFRKF